MRPLARAAFLVAAILVYGAWLCVPLLFLLLPLTRWHLAGYAAFAAVSFAWQRIHAARLFDAGLPAWPSFLLAALLFILGCAASELAGVLHAIVPSDDGSSGALPPTPVLDVIGGLLEAYAPASHGDLIIGSLVTAFIAPPLGASILLALVPTAHRERAA
jgi:hypothetical protein